METICRKRHEKDQWSYSPGEGIRQGHAGASLRVPAHKEQSCTDTSSQLSIQWLLISSLNLTMGEVFIPSTLAKVTHQGLFFSSQRASYKIFLKKKKKNFSEYHWHLIKDDLAGKTATILWTSDQGPSGYSQVRDYVEVCRLWREERSYSGKMGRVKA